MSIRVAVVISHPIQHFCPQYSSWARIDGLDLKVFFASRHGLEAYEDKGFGREVKWDSLELDFPYKFLPGAHNAVPGPRIDSDDLPQILEEFVPDLLIVYGYAQRLQRRAIRWGKQRKIPMAMIADSELRQHRGWLKRLVKRLVLPRILDKIDIFMTVGDANENYYRQYSVADTQFVRSFFPIDIKAFDAVSPVRQNVRERLRRELGIPERHTVILKVGKFVSWKRQEDLVKFSNYVQTTRSDITVILVGTGPEEEMLRSKAEKIGSGGVIFAGFIAPSKLVEYYAAADIYVHCSEIEPHSLAISEAVYSGLPVVLSDRCGSYGPSDDVRPGLNGLVYLSGSVLEMSSAILMIVSDNDLRRSMGYESRLIGQSNQSLAHGKALLQAFCLLKGVRQE